MPRFPWNLEWIFSKRCIFRKEKENWFFRNAQLGAISKGRPNVTELFMFPWPLKSPNLTPMAFYLYRYFTSDVHIKSQTVSDYKDNIKIFIWRIICTYCSTVHNRATCCHLWRLTRENFVSNPSLLLFVFTFRSLPIATHFRARNTAHRKSFWQNLFYIHEHIYFFR